MSINVSLALFDAAVVVVVGIVVFAVVVVNVVVVTLLVVTDHIMLNCGQ